MLDLSELGALVEDSIPEGGLITGGFPAREDACCTAEAEGFWFGLGVDRGGLRSWLLFRDNDGIWDIVPGSRSEVRMGEGSRDEPVELSAEVEAEMLEVGVVDAASLGIWDVGGV